ncbi:hypothetical protein L915_10750, partial [Phytophthora nicotianae]
MERNSSPLHDPYERDSEPLVHTHEQMISAAPHTLTASMST